MTTYGLIGFPLGHSFSAQYFAEKFEREGIAARYDNYALTHIADLPALLMRQPELMGFNVTIPYKQAILPYLDDLSPEARAIGAVNVVRVERSKGRVRLVGYNTDAPAFADTLRPLLPEACQSALVLGTGGAAKAVQYALAEMGIAVTLVSRTRRDEHCITYADVTPQVLADHLVVVNCTPLGMSPDVTTCPPLPYDHLSARHVLYDLVYNPAETRFMAEGRRRGSVVKGGWDMLRAQAEGSYRIWCKA